MIPSDKPHLHVAVNSHTGEARTKNEDRYSVTAYHLERSATPALLAIVADGIGGHKAGEIAAHLTVETIVNSLMASKGHQPKQQLAEAVIEANRVVSQAAQADDTQQGMGSTVVIAWIIGSKLYTATVGDSRIYLQRQGSIRQISIDHTWVQEAIDHEIIQPGQARDHPQAHVLRRHIGAQQETLPDFRLRLKDNESDKQSEANQGLQLNRNDTILLCSDGLTDLVEDFEIQQALIEEEPLNAVTRLTNMALGRGGHDNITIVILKVPEPQDSYVKSRRRSNRALVWLITFFALGLLLVAELVLIWILGLWPWQ